MYRFSQGLSPIRYDDSDDFNSPDMGYIDRDGELEFEPQFTYAYPFSEGFTMVRGSLKFVEYEIMGIDGIFLDKNSLKPASFSEGFLEIHDKDTGKSGFIDRSGTWVVEPRFEGTCRFGQGKAAVMSKSRGKWGYIDPNGHKVIAEKYDMAHVFKNGLAAVQEEGRLGYIDMSGKYVWRA